MLAIITCSLQRNYFSSENGYKVTLPPIHEDGCVAYGGKDGLLSTIQLPQKEFQVEAHFAQLFLHSYSVQADWAFHRGRIITKMV